MSRNKGLKSACVEYMQSNVDRNITLGELERELGNWERGSISSTMSKLCREDEFPVTRKSDGIYRWSSATPKKKDGIARGDLMEVMVVNEGNAKKVLVRDDHDEVWVAKRLNLEDV